MGFLAKCLGAFAALAMASGAYADGLADRVIVVANGDAPDSVAIARHYAQARGVPLANLILLKASTEETITWKDFVATIWAPLEERLVREGWIDAVAMDLFDEVGRRKYAFSGHKIAALVVCRGIPLRIANDPILYRDVPPLTSNPEFRTNEGAVDSELSLLAQTSYPINASVPNPLFMNKHPTTEDLGRVVKVSRLDAPTADEAMGLVDRALAAEKSGLLGRAYVDIAGPHESGNRWLESVAAQLAVLGFDTSVTRGVKTMSAAARIDAPVLYFGWYTPDLNGPFSLPGFSFPPGAIAVHIHSFSAHTLRSRDAGWCGPLLARGATATVGNVFEPYLEFLHRPDLLAEGLIAGDDLVDAAYYALPVLSWQSIVIGDPLYTPFRVSLDDQMRNLASLPPELAGYAVIRSMNLLDDAGKHADATELGEADVRKVPNLALALAVAERLRASGNKEAAGWMVRDAVESAAPSPGTWAVMREAAAFLAGSGRPGEAIELYRKLLESDEIPPEAAAVWLKEAREAALASGDSAQAAEWEERANRLAPRSP